MDFSYMSNQEGFIRRNSSIEDTGDILFKLQFRLLFTLGIDSHFNCYTINIKKTILIVCLTLSNL